MSLEKAIAHGKDWRRLYRGSRRFDRSCRNHGGCPWCTGGRLYKNQKVTPADLADQLDEEKEK